MWYFNNDKHRWHLWYMKQHMIFGDNYCAIHQFVPEVTEFLVIDVPKEPPKLVISLSSGGYCTNQRYITSIQNTSPLIKVVTIRNCYTPLFSLCEMDGNFEKQLSQWNMTITLPVWHQGLALLTLSSDKNWDSHSLVNGYPSPVFIVG